MVNARSTHGRHMVDTWSTHGRRVVAGPQLVAGGDRVCAASRRSRTGGRTGGPMGGRHLCRPGFRRLQMAPPANPRRTPRCAAAFADSPGRTCARWVHREGIPTRPASDWSVVRIYPHALRLIGPS
eukprot:1194954-Prorocentrum_minimum.AAC.1